MTDQLEQEQLAELDAIAGDVSQPGGAAPGEPEPGTLDAGPAPEPAAPPGPPTSDLLLPVIALGLDSLAPAWAVSDAEKQGLAEAYGALIDKYLPGGLGAFGVELNALLITAAVFGPRWRKPKREGEQEPVPEQPGTDDQGQGAGYTVDADAMQADEPHR